MKLYKLTLAFVVCLLIANCTLSANAQGFKLSGIITDSLTNKPVSNAAIYIGNSSIAASADTNGRYVFNGLRPGNYTLVISCIGYAPVQVILTKDETININLSIQVTELAEVNIRADNNWYRNLGVFTQYFIAGSEYSSLCKIVNNDVLKLEYKGRIISASTKDF